MARNKTLIDQAAETIEAVLPTIESAVESAREKATPLLEEARENAGPILEQGKALAAEKAEQGKSLAAEGAAVGAAVAASTIAKLKGEEKPKKRRKLKGVLLFGLFAGLAFVLYKKFTAN